MKSNKQTKAIEGKSDNQSVATNIFNDLIKKRKIIINELYESVDKNKLYFEYVSNTKDVSFYEYMDSKEPFDEIKNNRLRFDGALKIQKELLKKMNEVKMGRKTFEQEKVISNLENVYKCREQLFNFFRDYAKMMLDSGYKAKQDETKGTGI